MCLLPANNKYESVLIHDIQKLTFYKEKQTISRLESSFPQLNCIGGSANCAYTPDIVHCFQYKIVDEDRVVRLRKDAHWLSSKYTIQSIKH